MIGPNDLKDLQKQLQKDSQIESLPEEEYLVEHLDYQYIEKCTDLKELRLLQNVLESGKEGYYPQLLEFLKNRIHSIQPVETEIVDFVDLANSLKEMENSLQEKVQRQVQTEKSSKSKIETTKAQNHRIKSGDYRRWEKFNVEEELEKIDTCDIMIKDSKLSEIPNVESKLNLDISKIKLKSKGEIEVLAEQEKIKGNECFRAGEYNDAIAYYTRSLQIMKRAHVFTNRANAFLKIGQYERAEMDSSAALEMNDTLYIFKAFVRRAEARRKRGKLWDALQDINSAIKIDPKSALANNLRIHIEAEYKKVEGDLARGAKTRIKIEEDEPVLELQPSSIREVTEEEIQAFLPQKEKLKDDISIQKVDDFIQGLKKVTPEFAQSVPEEIARNHDETYIEESTGALKVEDVEAVDEDCEAFKREIFGSSMQINDDKVNVDHETFCKKEQCAEGDTTMTELANNRDPVKKATTATKRVIDIRDTEELDTDCLNFRDEIECMSVKVDATPKKEGISRHISENPSSSTGENYSTPYASNNLAHNIPKSSIEFEAAWNSMRGELKQFSAYWSKINLKDLLRYLTMINNADMHIDLVLSTGYIEDGERTLKILEFVMTLPRFKVVKSFMTKKQKQNLLSTLIKLKSEFDVQRIESIINNYNL